MSKYKVIKKMTALVLCLCGIISFSSCDALGNLLPFMNSASNENVSKEITLSIRKTDAPVSLIYTEVQAYLQADAEQVVTDFLSAGVYRHDQGKPFAIEYALESEGEMPKVTQMRVEFSFTQDFFSIVKEEIFTGAPSLLNVYNLQTGVVYYYRVTAELENGTKVSVTDSVEIEASPRMLYLEGANNVRDIGGWKTEDGKTIKQALLYRGSEIDGGKNSGHIDFKLTKKGIEQLRALGIKTDFDLRAESVKASEYSILGEDVTRNFYNAAQYEAILQPQNAERTRKIFSDLANPAAYPVYLHCTHGVDRAGSTIMILEALLGVAEADLVRDYELSAFYHNYRHVYRELNNGGTILSLINGLKGYKGATLAKKTESFLLSIGVTKAEIDSIRDIFLA